MQQIASPRSLLTLDEAARRLRISKTSLYRRIDAGELSSIHIGARHLVSEQQLEAYIARLEEASHDPQSAF